MRRQSDAQCTVFIAEPILLEVNVKRNVLPLVCVLALFTALQPGPQVTRAANPAAGKQLTIVLSVPALKFPFFVFMQSGLKKAAAAVGSQYGVSIKIIVDDAQSSATKQTTDVEAAIAQKVDGIILDPITTASANTVIKEIAKANIPVTTVDREAASSMTLGHVGADNVKGGLAEGLYAANALHGKGAVILLEGTPGSSPQIDRTKGIKAALARFPGIKIVFDQTAQFDRATAINVVEAATGSVKHFDAIVAENDDMALGALTAMKSKGMLGKVIITGFDALPETIKDIQAGTIQATVEQYPDRQATLALKVLLDYIVHHKKPAHHTTFITPVAISKVNLSQAVT
jgi:inositol transport system substrate-binding protein